MSNAQENKPQQYFIYHNREGYSDVYESEEKIIKEKPDMHVVKFADYQRLLDANKKLRDALISIEEFWNRDANEQAMQGACWHAVETAAAALSEAAEIERG